MEGKEEGVRKLLSRNQGDWEKSVKTDRCESPKNEEDEIAREIN